MRSVFRGRSFGVTVATILALVMTSPVSAQEKSPDDWQYSFELYAWTPRLELTPNGGEKITFKFSDILENLDMAGFADAEMRKGDWSLSVDMVYLNLGADQTRQLNPGPPIEVEAALDMRGYIGTLTAGHTIARTDRTRFDIIGGTRYTYIRNTTELDVVGTPREKKTILGGNGWDFLIGFEGKTLINDQWYFDYYADVGAGRSKLTWQAKVGMGYEFNKWTGTFGFRYLDYELEDTDTLGELTVYGPYIGAKWTW